MEKIDIHDSENAYKLAIEHLSQDKGISENNRNLIAKFLGDSAIGKTAGRKARIKSVGIRARLKNLYLLKTFGSFCKKDFKQLTIKDIEKFVHSIDSNEIRKQGGDKYSEQTKSNIKRTLKLFLRWLFGETNKKFIDMTYWIDTRFKQKSILSFDEKEIKEILNKCNTIKQKVLIACLFDGGFRIEEFLNVRLSDVKLVEGNVPYYRITIRNEFSKTNGRDVPMFWNETYEIMKEWFLLRDSAKKDEQFFNGTYNGVRSMLIKLSGRTGKEINAHKFRHSSATFYANKGQNEFQLNKRYGWSSNSDMGRRYVETAKINIEENKQVQEYESEKLDEIKIRLKQQGENNNLLQQRMKGMEEVISFLLKGHKGKIISVEKQPDTKFKTIAEFS